MRNNKMVLLFPLPHVRNIDLSYLLSSHHTVHARHIDIHNNELVSLLIVGDPSLAFLKSLLSRYGLIGFDLVVEQKDVLKDHQVENCIVHKEDLWQLAEDYVYCF